ncbi:MAG: hypothetical protein HGA22_08370 [Clostridiales bacterium]|nr:hypothetical protein [Clostridiales bacterium]
MKKTLTAITVCIFVMTFSSAAMAVQSVTYDFFGTGQISQTSLSSGVSYLMIWSSSALTTLDGKSLTSAFVEANVLNHQDDEIIGLNLEVVKGSNTNLGGGLVTTDGRWNQLAINSLIQLNTSIQDSIKSGSPLELSLQQQFGTTNLAGTQVNLRGVVAPEPASIALVCAGLVALPFARKLKNKL